MRWGDPEWGGPAWRSILQVRVDTLKVGSGALFRQDIISAVIHATGGALPGQEDFLADLIDPDWPWPTMPE